MSFSSPMFSTTSLDYYFEEGGGGGGDSESTPVTSTLSDSLLAINKGSQRVN